MLHLGLTWDWARCLPSSVCLATAIPSCSRSTHWSVLPWQGVISLHSTARRTDWAPCRAQLSLPAPVPSPPGPSCRLVSAQSSSTHQCCNTSSPPQCYQHWKGEFRQETGKRCCCSRRCIGLPLSSIAQLPWLPPPARAITSSQRYSGLGPAATSAPRSKTLPAVFPG